MFHCSLASAQPELRLAGDLQAQRLVDLVSERLDVSIQYEPRALSQSVTLRLHDALNDDELWEVLTSTLESLGLVVVELQSEGVYKVVPLQQAASQHQRVEIAGETPGLGPSRSSFAAVVIEPRGLTAQEVVAALGPMLSQGAGSARPIGDTGLVLVADVRRRVESALALLERIDAPAPETTRFIREMEHGSAAAVATSVRQVLEAEAGDSVAALRLIPTADDRRLIVVSPESIEPDVRGLLDEFDAAPAVETRSYAVAGVAPQDLAESLTSLLSALQAAGAQRDAGPAIVADRLTGVVLVTATEAAHERAEHFVERLRERGGAGARGFRAIRVRNRDAGDLLETVESLLQERPESPYAAPGMDERSEDAPPPAEPMVGPGLGETGDERLTISIDEHTNTLLAYGDPAALAELEALVSELDRRQPQVMLEATLVSLSDGEALDLGVQLMTQFESGDTTIDLSSLFGLGGGGLAMGTGFTGSIVNPGDFEALIRAVESVNDGRSLSTPRVLVNNNATGTLRAVAREPFTSLNASDTVATTSFGGTSDAGTTITVTPQIAEGDHLVLEYSVELSSFTGEATTTEGGGVVPPPSQQNSIDGSVTIPDGFTVVLGGLEDIADNESETRSPLLGELPLIGALFRTRSESVTRSRFYVFIRATILRDPLFADLRTLSERDLRGAGVDGGAPTLEPIWLD